MTKVATSSIRVKAHQAREWNANLFVSVAAKTAWQKQYLENIWGRIVHQNSIYNSPWNILQIYASFQSYFQKYDRSRQHLVK